MTADQEAYFALDLPRDLPDGSVGALRMIEALRLKGYHVHLSIDLDGTTTVTARNHKIAKSGSGDSMWKAALRCIQLVLAVYKE